jgi:group I intron endonuclease
MRTNKRLSGIYKIRSITNNKEYIGSSVNIYKRFKDHKRLLKRNKHHSHHLQNHFNKYGEDDLEFTIIELVNDISLLILKEQHYIDSLKPKFNICLVAGSPLGTKRTGSKYYSYFKKSNLYRVYYNIGGIVLNLKCHFTEADAIKEVEYVKTLTKEELIEYSKKCKVAPKPRSRSFKGYTFNKSNNKWDVRITIEGKQQYFGSFLTQQEAISKVNEVTKKRMQHTTM